jgi:hypothetical protein
MYYCFIDFFIKKGYYAGRQGTNFDTPNLNSETGIPFSTNLQY